ncbi:DUF6232 family protein [Chromobacterium piscinae]|uniref:DUF6232 family protein n=1 Tax=Chromobacterium piscinae TaxID=686831 RepID=UPI003F7E0E7A
MTSVANELIKLNELKEKGVISQEEFESQKKKLLAGGDVEVKDPEDKVFFSDRGVKVTTTLFSLPNNRVFAMSGVTAVRAHKNAPSKFIPIVVLIIGGLAFLGGLKNGDVWVGLVLLIIGGAWYASLKTKYYVVLSTASGETQALQDLSETWILQVVEALNACIVHRG